MHIRIKDFDRHNCLKVSDSFQAKKRKQYQNMEIDS